LLQSIIPFVRVKTPPTEAPRQSSSESTTGVKIRMKGYGAIVENANNSTVVPVSYPQPQEPQLTGNSNHHNESKN
jgi:hypothetical protein